jgi:hypothetical protein
MPTLRILVGEILENPRTGKHNDADRQRFQKLVVTGIAELESRAIVNRRPGKDYSCWTKTVYRAALGRIAGLAEEHISRDPHP